MLAALSGGTVLAGRPDRGAAQAADPVPQASLIAAPSLAIPLSRKSTRFVLFPAPRVVDSLTYEVPADSTRLRFVTDPGPTGTYVLLTIRGDVRPRGGLRVWTRDAAPEVMQLRVGLEAGPPRVLGWRIVPARDARRGAAGR